MAFDYVFFFVCFVMINSIFEPGRHRWVFWPYIISDFINLCFAIGALCYLVPQCLSLRKKKCGMIIILVLICLISLPKVYEEKITLTIIACACFYFLLHAQPVENMVTSLLAYLGNASYSIYLTHVVFNSLSWYVIKINITYGIILTFLAILFGCLIHEVIEKPISNVFRGSKKRIISMEKK